MIDSLMSRDVAINSWRCNECDYKSSVRGDMKNHIEAKHVENSSVSCNICGFVTKTRKALKMHKYRVIVINCSIRFSIHLLFIILLFSRVKNLAGDL